MSLYARGEVTVWKGWGLRLTLMLLKQLMEKRNGGNGDISVIVTFQKSHAMQ